MKDPDEAAEYVEGSPGDTDNVCKDVLNIDVRKDVVSADTVLRRPDDAEYTGSESPVLSVDARSVPGDADTGSSRGNLCLGGAGGEEEGGDMIVSRVCDKKSLNLYSEGQAEYREATLRGKIQLFENLSQRRIQAEVSTENYPTRNASNGGLDLIS